MKKNVEQEIVKYEQYNDTALNRTIDKIRDRQTAGWRVVAMASTPEYTETYGYLIVVYEK